MHAVSVVCSLLSCTPSCIFIPCLRSVDFTHFPVSPYSACIHTAAHCNDRSCGLCSCCCCCMMDAWLSWLTYSALWSASPGTFTACPWRSFDCCPGGKFMLLTFTSEICRWSITRFNSNERRYIVAVRDVCVCVCVWLEDEWLSLNGRIESDCQNSLVDETDHCIK